jgi:hypothetical protein
MVTKRLKRPRDPVSLAKLIGDIATGQLQDEVEDRRDPTAVELGKRGGRARAVRLTKGERIAIARKAAKKRWHQ